MVKKSMTEEERFQTMDEKMKQKVGTTKEQLQKVNWATREERVQNFLSVHLVIFFILAIFLGWDLIISLVTSLI